MITNIEALIEQYLCIATRCADAFLVYSHGIHPIKAFHQRLIEGTGELQIPEKIKYSVHGIGCRFTALNWDIDVDFNTHGECGGFDAWRLWEFGKSIGGCDMLNLKNIEIALAILQENGRISRSSEAPCTHLFQSKMSDPGRA
jgi:hypothetical protein